MCNIYNRMFNMIRKYENILINVLLNIPKVYHIVQLSYILINYKISAVYMSNNNRAKKNKFGKGHNEYFWYFK